MTEYIVRGYEEVYGLDDEIEKEIPLQWIRVETSSLEEALDIGRKNLQKEVCKSRLTKLCSKMYVAQVDLIFDKTRFNVLYRSEKIKKQDKERANDKFDLQAAIRDGCVIDESGLGTCAG